MASGGENDGKTPGTSSPDSDLDARRRALESRLEGAAPDGRAAQEPSGLVKLFRFSADFVSGVLAGALIGWLVDRFAGTRPWGLIVFLLLGFATGIYNLVRSAQRANREG